MVTKLDDEIFSYSNTCFTMFLCVYSRSNTKHTIVNIEIRRVLYRRPVSTVAYTDASISQHISA